MYHKQRIQGLLEEIAAETLAFISQSEYLFDNRWVPAVYIKKHLNLTSHPTARTECDRDRIFSVLTCMLEDKSMLECEKRDALAFYRSTKV